MKKLKASCICLIASLGVSATAFAGDDDGKDFGSTIERRLHNRSHKFFGIKKPLEQSAPETTGAFRTPTQTADDQVLLAGSLKAEYLTREAGNQTDMIAFFRCKTPRIQLPA